MDAALRESERFTSRLAEVLPVGIFRTDAEGRPVYLNERCHEIAGLRPEEARAVTAIWPPTEWPEEHAAFVEAGRRSRDEAAPFDQELRFLRPDGTPVWALVQALPDFDEDGRFVGHVGTITEITESRRVAEELARHRDRLGELVAERTAELERTHERLRESERLAAVGTFAAGIAHQINNPVGGILLAAQYAKDRSQEGQTVATALESIIADARRCGRIVRGVLEFARGDVGERKACDLNRIVRDASAQVAYDAHERAAAVELVLSDALPPLHASESALDQVVTNLLQNALDAGAHRVLVRTAGGPDGFVVEVEDDGCGIPPEDLAHLVAPFFTTRRERGGTGLGLTLAQGIVRAHGGRIEFSSGVGRGTTVRVRLPPAGGP
jgi:PAS domain S-box-containing protein